MITDLANLGPPLRGTPDLGGTKAGSKKEDAAGNPESRELGKNSFDQTLKSKLQANDKKSSPAPMAKERSANHPREAYTKPTESKVGERPKEAKESVSEKEQGEMMSVVQAKAKKPQDGNVSDKELVMLQFMDSMESEFGIPPTDVVEAMTNLTDADMLKSPEDNAQKFISQFNLEPQDQQRAMALYLGMVAQWSALQNEKSQLQPAMALAAAPILQQPEVLTPGQKLQSQMTSPQDMMPMSMRERRAILNKNLDKMNQNFFMKAPAQQKMTAEAQAAPEALGPDTALMRDGQSLSTAGMDRPLYDPSALDEKARMQYPQKNYPPLQPAQPNAQASQAANAQALSQNEEEALPPELLKSLAALGAAAGAIGQSMKEPVGQGAAMKAESATTQNSQNVTSMNSQMMATQGLNAKDKGFEDSLSDGEKKDFLSSKEVDAKSLKPMNASTDFTLNPKDLPKSAAIAGGASAGAMAAANNSEQPANLQQLMNQAQYLIKKGGGEAKIQMNQEGLGNVHMKIAVNDGKVNVQMAAETKEAKNAIESSLADLKSSLNTHKLSVEHIKVDVGNQLSSDNRDKGSDSQTSQHKQQMDFRSDDGGRESARQFMSQFREENMARREYSNMPNLRGYENSRKVEPLKPAESTNVAAKRYAGASKGSGLDLVA